MKNNLQKQSSKIDLIYSCYSRFLALVCLGLSVLYWVRLVGVFPGVLWRFDLMPWQWQFASATLAIIYPIALVGLWMYSFWGIILWCIAAFIEMLMMYYANPIIISLYSILFLVFIALRIIKIVFFKKNIINE